MVKETTTQRKRRLEKEKRKRQEKLQQESEASKSARLAKQRDVRARETSQEREARLRRQREAYARRKQAEEIHKEQCNVEYAIAKDGMVQARLNETVEVRRSSRLAKDVHRQAKTNETINEPKYIVNSALVTISRMVKETATQRKRRLAKKKQKRREKLQQESEAGKSARLAKRRKQEQEVRARETSQERESRLRRQRAAYAQRMDEKCDAEIENLYKIIQQGGVLNQIQPSSPAAVTTPNMPQHQGGVPTATVLPCNVGARQLFTRPATLYNPNALYHQQYTMAPRQKILAKPNLSYTKYPIHPDVKFKRLPFFDILSELVKPSTLIAQNNSRQQEYSFYFHLTPQQVKDIASSKELRHDGRAEFIKQIQMRFCLMETSCKQEDSFPPGVVVIVNNTQFALPNPIPTNKPGVEPKRPPRPVNITQLIKLNPTTTNTIHVSWTHDYDRAYVITVSLVHKKNSTDLLQRMKTCGPKHSDHTRGIIKEKLNEDGDSEIATTSLRVSLMCPLGKMRMANPCRAKTCQHLQCFDALLYLQMNERKPTWLCPVCNKLALYEDLDIDGYFQDVLCSPQLNSDISEIQLHKDGSWSIYSETKKPSSAEVLKVNTIDDSVEIIFDNGKS